MNSSSAIAQLRALRPELSRRGISALYLFGSLARGDSGAHADIDLAFELEDDSKFNLFDQALLQAMIAERLGRSVDFLAREAIHPDLKPGMERDLVRVF